MKLTKNRIISIIFAFVLFYIFILSNVCPIYIRADDSDIKYTSVMDDLTTDEGFNLEDYPVDESNFSLSVIALSESINYELFVYVYVPSGDKIKI